MRVADLLTEPSYLAAVREVVLQIQREVAPEEVEVTIDYVDPFIELAARNEFPAADTPSEAGQFGAAEWMLLPIVFLVMGVLQTRIESGNAEEITEPEIRALIRRSGSVYARRLASELARAIQKAFSDHLAALLHGEEPAEAREVRHTDISCPRQVWKEIPGFQVAVRLVLAPAPGSAAEQTLEPLAGEAVQVWLHAPAFDLLDPAYQEIAVPPRQDSAPAVFHLRPREAGPKEIFLDFFQATRLLGAVSVPVEVSEQPVAEAPAVGQAMVLSLEREVPHPDRTLRIVWDSERSSLEFTLIRENWPETFPPVRLSGDPRSLAAELLKELDVLTGEEDPTVKAVAGTKHELSKEEVERRLKKAGYEIWRRLPQELRSLYTRERRDWTRKSSLLICSDEPYLPWELVWPYGEGWEDEGPWCLTLRLSRWLSRKESGEGNPGPPGSLSLTAVACIATSDLEKAEQERASLLEWMRQIGIRDVSPRDLRWKTVMDLLESKGYDWLHVASHGSFHAEAPELHSAIWLDRRTAITPQHFAGPKIEDHLRQERPAFFFNACHTGRLGWGFSGLGGWAQRLIACGAGMFLGPLFAVEDESALLMSQSFYEQLRQGKTLAEAARKARLEAREKGNAMWAAYSLYAHPNARVRLPDLPLL